MKSEASESRIIAELAERVGGRLARRTIRFLQSIRDARLSGDDSPLRDAWDEVCVQMRGEESIHWEVYVDTIETFLIRCIEELPNREREALWLATPEGENWLGEETTAREAPPVLIDDVVEHILTERLWPAAYEWSNARIRAYLGED